MSSGYIAVRLNESLYGVKSSRDDGNQIDELGRIVGFTGTENSCLPPGIHNPKKPENTEISKPRYPERGNHRDTVSKTLSGHIIYIDSDISANLRNKVSSLIFWRFFLNVFCFSMFGGHSEMS